MPIIEITTYSPGLIDVIPRFIYIDTNDTLNDVLAVGYLNQSVQAGFVFYTTDVAVVTIQSDGSDTPTSALLQVTFDGLDWSLSMIPAIGGVEQGQQNDLAYYAETGRYVSPLTTGNSAILATNGSGVPAWSTAMTNGQVMVGVTGSNPIPNTLQAGLGIEISNTAGTITIATTGSEGSWINQTTSTVQMEVETGYTINNGATLVTLTLPSTSTYGDYLEINGMSAGGWTIAQQGGQNIQINDLSTTVGVGGALSSTNQYDCVRLRCIVPNTTWTVVSQQSHGLDIV